MTTMMGTSVAGSADPTSMLNTQLASALATLGDAQFWEETISPSTIRSELSASDPSNPNSTPTLLKGMKWLLASISKGRDVSDFYPHVVKLVGATNMEVRKMVYMYLVQYADHDATTRELSLLSINSFQRGLADHEQWIRALALRVLSSIRIPDIIQIQILGVQKCAKDRSPYVRKCAANALAKLAPRCDESQREMLLDVMKDFLDNDTSTMVLSTAMVAFCELCPTRLELLHASFRKICHLLTDMDEWGQVVTLDVLSRYCRTFFKAPRGWKGGTAEKIDQSRRVRRKVVGNLPGGVAGNAAADAGAGPSLNIMGGGSSTDTPLSIPAPTSAGGGFTDTKPQKIKRRVVQKGFYSDDEDESTEEEVYAETPLGPAMSTATAMRQRNILGLPGVVQPIAVNPEADEDMDLEEDHRLLLQSASPLLKSRNAGVVLGVCSLLYFCGVSSVKTRSAIGKALVRIHRSRREIQYVVLTSIRTLVTDCPSAFAPYLNDFFVKALDPPQTRIIKIDILVSLALEPAAIEAVLEELRTYIRSGDKKFVCAAIRAVGRVAELARIVCDRHGQKSGDLAKERGIANLIALDCLYGLVLVTQTDDCKVVVGEAVSAMRNILIMLASDLSPEGTVLTVKDPNQVQSQALRRTLLMLVYTLSKKGPQPEKLGGDDDDDDEVPAPSALETLSFDLPPNATAAAMAMIGDWLSASECAVIATPTMDASAKSKMRQELLRLIDRAFPELDSMVRNQAVHFATKTMLASVGANPVSATTMEVVLCEHILSMGRIDVNPDVKDQARMASAWIHQILGLKYDLDNLEVQLATSKQWNVSEVKAMLLQNKEAPSYLPIDDEATVDNNSFRFGTLSSLVGHQARGTYLPLPAWATKNSPSSLRDPVAAVKEQVSGVPASNPASSTVGVGSGGGFYDDGGDSDSDSSSSSSSSESSSDESSDGDDADTESEDSSDSDPSPAKPMGMPTMPAPNMNVMAPMGTGMGMQQNIMSAPPAVSDPMAGFTSGVTSSAVSADSSSSSSESSEDSSSSSSSDDDEPYRGDVSSNMLLSTSEGNLLAMSASVKPTPTSTGMSSMMDDFKGMVMTPVAVEETAPVNPNVERDSSRWSALVRPELCGGLSVRARYLRGVTRAKEAQSMGADPSRSNVVCVQMEFGNQSSGGRSLRRIRVLPRSGGGSIPCKVLAPPEIAEIPPGQTATIFVVLDFQQTSNREGDLVGRLHVQSSAGGSVPVELKPPLGELLMGHKESVADFDRQMERMQGFQRVTSKFEAKSPNWAELLWKEASWTKIGPDSNPLRLAGRLPASDDIVRARVEWDATKKMGSMVVCCDHAVAVNSLMTILKHAVV